MGYGQSLLLVISAILIVVCIVILIIIAAVWSVSNYYVIDRETYDPVVCFLMFFIYSHTKGTGGIATSERVQVDNDNLHARRCCDCHEDELFPCHLHILLWVLVQCHPER